MTIDFEKMAKGESINDGNDSDNSTDKGRFHRDIDGDQYAMHLAKVLNGVLCGPSNAMIKSLQDKGKEEIAYDIYNKMYVQLNKRVNELFEQELRLYKQAVGDGETERTKADFLAITRSGLLTSTIHLMIGVLFNIANGPKAVMPLLTEIIALLAEISLSYEGGRVKIEEGKAEEKLQELYDIFKNIEGMADPNGQGDTTDDTNRDTTSNQTPESGENTSDGPQH